MKYIINYRIFVFKIKTELNLIKFNGLQTIYLKICMCRAVIQ